MDNLFGTIFGAGMDPAVTNLQKKAKKRFDQGMVPEIMKADGTTGPKPTNVGKRMSIWEKITRGQ